MTPVLVPHDIFISYSSKDKPTADALCATLEGKGLRCWIAPRDVLPGTDWSEAIIDAINGSRAFVLVYSDHANASPQIRREVERAVHKGIPIVPLRIEDVPMSKALEYFISTPHWLDAITPPLQRHLDYLAESLKRLIGGPPAEGHVIPGPVPRPKPVLTAGPIVAIVSALVVVAAAAMYFNKSSDGAGANVGGSGAVSQELVGSWTAQTVVNGLPITVETVVDAAGRTKVTSTFRDYGRYTSGGGRWSMINTAGQRTNGTYLFLGDTTMSFTGPLGTATWTREPGSASDGRRLLGSWSTSGPAPDGLPAKTTLVFGSDGTYRLTASSEETAQLNASGGRWRSVSTQTNRPTEGTYQVIAPDSLLWNAPTGTLTYTRRR